jgi:hypothetical protein
MCEEGGGKEVGFLVGIEDGEIQEVLGVKTREAGYEAWVLRGFCIFLVQGEVEESDICEEEFTMELLILAGDGAGDGVEIFFYFLLRGCVGREEGIEGLLDMFLVLRLGTGEIERFSEGRFPNVLEEDSCDEEGYEGEGEEELEEDEGTYFGFGVRGRCFFGERILRIGLGRDVLRRRGGGLCFFGGFFGCFGRVHGSVREDMGFGRGWVGEYF